MEINRHKKISITELKLLKDIICLILELPSSFENWEDIYQISSHKLKENVDISEISDAEELLLAVGIKGLSQDFEVFVLNEIPTNIYKLSWRKLKEQWDDVWCPPMDDGLLIYIPNNKLVLLTHWDIAYFN